MNKVLPSKSKTPLQLKLFHTLLGLGVFFSLITVPAESQAISVFGIYVPSQLLWWPEVFFIFYIIHSVYGFSYLRHSVYLLIFFRILYLLFLKLAIYLPAASFWKMQVVFEQVLGRDWLYITASSILMWGCAFIPYKILKNVRFFHLSCVYLVALIPFTLIDSLLTTKQITSPEFYVLITVIIYSLLLLISKSLVKMIIRLEQFEPQDSNNNSVFRFRLPSDIVNNNKFFKYHHILFCSSVVFFIASKTMASKFIAIGFFTINVGGIVFSLAYLASDIMTDVYGIERTKQMILFVLFCNLLFVFDIWITNLLAINEYGHFKVILHNQTRIFVASGIAFFLGMTVNSAAISIIKSKQRRRIILKKEFIATVWTRIATSASVGIILDVTLFSLIAFYSMVPSEKLTSIILFEDIYKISYEVLLAPVSVLLIYLLKVTEKVDIYDERTNLNPFKINTNYQFNANKFYENYKQVLGKE